MQDIEDQSPGGEAKAPQTAAGAASFDLDPEIARMLTPTIESIVRDTIRNDPKWVSDTILPGLGPAIRRTVADSFRHMVEQVNDALDYSLSREGLKWRIEAAKSGRSFAEIVLYNTLVYRVEQILLIHRKTGLLLTHVTTDGVAEGNADMVSSMLTAIQDFARDAFDAGDTDVLKTMEVGELKVWIQGGPRVLLAAVIRGNAPREFRTRLDQLIEDVVLNYSGELERFEGESTPFNAVKPLMEGCLLEDHRKPRKSMPALLSILALLILGIGTLSVLEIRDRFRWKRYFESLDQTPGIIVSGVYRRGNTYSLAGLRDPLSMNPLDALARSGLDTNRVSFEWEAYNALSAEFIIARAHEALNPPETVSLELVGNILVAKGSAPRDWIREASLMSKALPGVSVFSDAELVDLDTSEYEILVWEFKEKSFRDTRKQIEDVVIDFQSNTTSAANKLMTDIERIRDLLIKLGGLARFLNKDVTVEVLAIVRDTPGGKSISMIDAGQSADSVRDTLIQAGIKDIKMMSRVERSQTPFQAAAPVLIRVLEKSSLE